MSLRAYEENDVRNIANAIRGKTGTADTYTVSAMAPAINNIQGGGNYDTLNVSSNGEYTPSGDVDAWNVVNVQVPSSVPDDVYYANATDSYCGSAVTNMAFGYYMNQFLTNTPVVGNNVTNLYNYCGFCNNITSPPLVSDATIDMSNSYTTCQKMTGSPVCGNDTVYMNGTYRSCIKLNGSPVCGPNVKYMIDTYNSCSLLTGQPVIGNEVTHANGVYYGCRNLTGEPVCPDSVIYLSTGYRDCINLSGNFVAGNRLEQFVQGMYNAPNVKNYYFKPLINNLLLALWTNPQDVGIHKNIYLNFYDNVLDNVNWQNVPDATFKAQSFGFGGNGMLGNAEVNANIYVMKDSWVDWYLRRVGMITTNVAITWTNFDNGNGYFNKNINVIYTDDGYNIHDYINYYYTQHTSRYTSAGILNQINTIILGNTASLLDNNSTYNMWNFCMRSSYSTVIKQNHIDRVIIGDDVTDLYGFAYDLRQYSFAPACGNNVVTMFSAFSNCWGMTGSPVIGENVVVASQAYWNCRNLTGSPYIPANVTTAFSAFSMCENLTGDLTIYSKKINNASSLGGIISRTKVYNVRMYPNCDTFNSFIKINSSDWNNSKMYSFVNTDFAGRPSLYNAVYDPNNNRCYLNDAKVDFDNTPGATVYFDLVD